jgi:NAD(P)-dependent dehydrogenase (short-subunit alcohol dehydrogenase family)
LATVLAESPQTPILGAEVEMRMAGSAALITGGSRGLGRALGAELARRGARVVLTARGGGALVKVVDEIRAAGGEAHALVADVGDKDAIYPLVGAATALVGPIDVLVHNASVLGSLPLLPLADTDCEEFQNVLDVNLLGPFRLTKAVAGSMAIRGGGLVLAISSDAAVAGYPGWGAYGVSKAALDHLLKTWAAELPSLRFASLDPGEMDTEMHAAAIPDADRASLRDPALVAAVIADWIEAGDATPNGARVEITLPVHA